MGKKRVVAKQGEEALTPTGGQFKLSRKKAKKQIAKGIAHIFSSYNNTIITISDMNGNVLTSSSAGGLGFRGTKKSTPYAATLAARAVAEKTQPFGMVEIGVHVSGVGPGREAAVRGLSVAGLNITSIQDTTPIPHNGVKSRKSRRV